MTVDFISCAAWLVVGVCAGAVSVVLEACWHHCKEGL